MEGESGYIFSPRRNDLRTPSRRRQCLACVKILTQLPKLFGDYIFSSYHFENRPRNGRAYMKLFQLNIIAAVATMVGGLLLFELSDKALSHAMNHSAIFPLYLPHAIGLALACKFQGSVLVGNFLGFYFTRIYLVIRGPPSVTVGRSLILLLVALFGVLETHIGAWLMQHYLCRRSDGGKKVPTIDNVSQAFFYILIVVGTTLVFDTLIAAATCVSEIVMWYNFLRFWATWWLGVVAGMLTLSPAIIHLLAIGVPNPFLKLPNYCNLVKSILLWVVLAGILVLVFFFSVQSFVRPLPYLVFPLIIFASFRFNRVGWALVVAVISLCCAWGTLHRNSALYHMAGAPADKASPSLILQIELFVSVMGLVGIVLAAAVKEKIQLTNDLNKVNEDLEETVATRTNELVKANSELLISQKRAEHASHAKSDFLANMSHEIRTPIHGILGLTSLLLESQLTPDQRESLMSVKECADLLLHIINSVLDLSKIEAGRLEVETIQFSMRKMVSSTLRMMQARAQAHKLQLLWHFDDGVPDEVVGDPGKLQQCLLNLVGNALKFTNEGSVTVRVRMPPREVRQVTSLELEDTQSRSSPAVEAPPLFPRPPRPPSRLAKLRSWASWPGPYFKVDSGKSPSCTIDVHDSSDSDGYQNTSTKVAPVPYTEICSVPSTPETVGVEFEVHDTGIGISKEKLQDMFNPFTQADASTSRLYGGTGLGLCIVQRFVELLGGTIWAESEVNKGSTFGFRVPFRLSSNTGYISKPESNRGPLRFSSLDAAVPPRPVPKNGLKRRAYSLDVLMRNMKFTLPSLVEGNDGEESVSSKTDSSGADSRGSSLQRTATEAAILTVLDAEAVHLSNESSQPPSEKSFERPVGLISGDLETTEGNSVSSDFGDARTTGLAIRTSRADRKSREGLPPSGRNDHKMHKFEKSYVRPKSSEEQRSKQPNRLPPSFDKKPSAGDSDPSRHSTVINVDDRTDGATGEQPVLNGLVEQPMFDHRPASDSQAAVQPLPVEASPQQPQSAVPLSAGVSQQQPETSAPPKQVRLMASPSAPDSAKGFRKPGVEDVERPLHILLAEDNLVNQKVASRQLQRHGHRVTIVNDGKLALEAVEADHEAYDLVLMDVQMPNMDGLQASNAIRDMESERNWGRLPILGLTAHAIQGYQETCLSHGMDGYLGKPFEIKQLLRIIQELLSSNRGHRDHG